MLTNQLAWTALSGGIVLVGFNAGCSGTKREPDGTASGGTNAGGGAIGIGGGAQGGSGGALTEPTPRYHPPAGFESCVHAKVEAKCADGWCQLPPSCFVMGSPETEWHHGLYTEDLTAVTLTHSIEIQQQEFSRADWQAITGSAPPGPQDCSEDECPVTMVSWWDALHVANLLSTANGHTSCYAPTGCTGELGVDLDCEGVAAPDASVYECEGFRLPTRAEAEYAARAGTISTFYSGDITVYADPSGCELDPALEAIAWYCHNSSGKPHVGGELSPNRFGLYDAIGNVNEWSNENQHYSSTPGGENPRGAVGALGDSPRRLRFGGQYDSAAYLNRPASLLSAPANTRATAGGLRLVRTLPD